MANQKILKEKQGVIDEVKAHVQESKSVILFDYRGIPDSETKKLRRKLRESNADFKVYKNTLMARAFNDLNIDINESLNGPSAFAYGDDQVAPVKILSDFAKDHPALSLKVGIIDGEVADEARLQEYAALPSREGLLTMLAGGMIGLAKDLSICLHLYAEQKENEEK